jgi:hypothetical protein
MAGIFGSYFNPLNELAWSKPSEVMSRYATSTVNRGATHVALGFRMDVVSFCLRVITVSSFLRIWLETVLDQPVPTCPCTMGGGVLSVFNPQCPNLNLGVS